MASPWSMPSVSLNGMNFWVSDLIFEDLFLSKFVEILMKVSGSLILFIAFWSMVWLTESKATEMSRDSIHSSSFVRFVVEYVEFRSWIGWKVL